MFGLWVLLDEVDTQQSSFEKIVPGFDPGTLSITGIFSTIDLYCPLGWGVLLDEVDTQQSSYEKIVPGIESRTLSMRGAS